jgi:chromosome segregation ATPase
MTYDPNVEPAPDRGIAMRIELAAGEGGIIGLTAIRPETDTQIELTFCLDKLMGAARAVRAKQQLPEIRHELDGAKILLNENRVRLAEIDAAFREAMTQRQEERTKATARSQEIYEEAATAHFASGRQGEFKPQGHIQGSLTRLKGVIDQIDAGQTKANEQHKVDRSQLENEIKKRRTAVEILERRIAECEALARGEDISGV